MTSKLIKGAIAIATVAAVGVATVDDAEARRGGRRVGGILLGTAIGLGIAGAYAHNRYYGYGPGYGYGPYYGYSSGPRCYPGPVRCRWSHSRHREVCWRPTYCD